MSDESKFSWNTLIAGAIIGSLLTAVFNGLIGSSDDDNSNNDSDGDSE